MKQINLNVVGDPKGDVPILIGDDGTQQRGSIAGARAVFVLLDSASGGATITYAGGRLLRVIIPPSAGAYEADQAPVRPPEAIGTIQLEYGAGVSRLHAADAGLIDEGGERVVLGLTTDFRLYRMYLDGEDVTAILAEREAAGAQGVRVFGTCVNLFDLDPRVYGPRYYQALPEFARLLAGRGDYLQFTAITDAQLLARNFDAAAHWSAVCDALADEPNVVVCELVNEYFKNGVEPWHFTRPTHAPAIVSVGSFVDGDFPPAPWGDVSTFHPTRSWKWWFTVAATAQEIRADHRGAGKPVWIGEPMGAAAAPRGDRSTDAACFEKLGVSIGVYAAGGVFHSDSGLMSLFWSEPEAHCAEAFFRGLHR
jgi:hypothetical protein